MITEPDLPYRPRDPQNYAPNIGLIGCGGIAEAHLTAYAKAGYRVVALCDINPKAAYARQSKFYPAAQVYTDYRALLARPDIAVVDIATHPGIRGQMIEDALLAGKHVLSQKPFVEDLALGQQLAELADQQGLKLAVNQNGRFAPHFSYIRQAVRAGLVGDIHSLQFTVNWDHNWIRDREFNNIKHIILYDFAIHWFDMVACLMHPQVPQRVVASTVFSPAQTATPALLAQAMLIYDQAHVSLVFNADTQYGSSDTTTVIGTKGTICSRGPSLSQQTVTLFTAQGSTSPQLEGSWFPDGFHGTMGELLCAIEEDRQPETNAHNNLRGLDLCFAAMRSADDNGRCVTPHYYPG